MYSVGILGAIFELLLTIFFEGLVLLGTFLILFFQPFKRKRQGTKDPQKPNSTDVSSLSFLFKFFIFHFFIFYFLFFVFSFVVFRFSFSYFICFSFYFFIFFDKRSNLFHCEQSNCWELFIFFHPSYLYIILYIFCIFKRNFALVELLRNMVLQKN